MTTNTGAPRDVRGSGPGAPPSSAPWADGAQASRAATTPTKPRARPPRITGGLYQGDRARPGDNPGSGTSGAAQEKSITAATPTSTAPRAVSKRAAGERRRRRFPRRGRSRLDAALPVFARNRFVVLQPPRRQRIRERPAGTRAARTARLDRLEIVADARPAHVPLRFQWEAVGASPPSTSRAAALRPKRDRTRSVQPTNRITAEAKTRAEVSSTWATPVSSDRSVSALNIRIRTVRTFGVMASGLLVRSPLASDTPPSRRLRAEVSRTSKCPAPTPTQRTSGGAALKHLHRHRPRAPESFVNEAAVRAVRKVTEAPSATRAGMMRHRSCTAPSGEPWRSRTRSKESACRPYVRPPSSSRSRQRSSY